MILTDDEIRAAIKAGEITIDPFDDGQIQPASIDLRVGDEGATAEGKRKVKIDEEGLIVLEPGGFGIVALLEKIKFGPQYVGRLGLRSKHARKGLIATTGPQVDPGFQGTITVGLVNLAPKALSLSHGDDLLTLEIHRLAKPVKQIYRGPYQGQHGLSADALDAIVEGKGMAFSEVLTSLQALTANVGALDQKFGDLAKGMSELTGQMKAQTWIVPLVVGIPFATITVLVGLMVLR